MTTDAIEPDDKDWTWVLREPCPECGLVAADVDPAAVGAALPTHVVRWQGVLRRSEVAQRARPDRWSDLEYACHVRDVLELFAERLEQVMVEDPARFANWDQDATARERDYAAAVPAEVAADLLAGAERLAQVLDRIGPGDWGRRALRSNGSEFTAATLVQYLAHDLEHHLVDVGA